MFMPRFVQVMMYARHLLILLPMLAEQIPFDQATVVQQHLARRAIERDFVRRKPMGVHK